MTDSRVTGMLASALLLRSACSNFNGIQSVTERHGQGASSERDVGQAASEERQERTITAQAELPLRITLPELESHLWEAANILRGSPVDQTDWKSYILPFLFFKRICH